MIIILYTAKWPKANEWGNGKNQMNEGMVKIKWIREWQKQMNEGMVKNQMNEGMTKTNEWGNDQNKWMREWPKQMNEGMTEAMSKRVDDMWLLYFMELMRE